ncbi:MAG: hypothetical protein ACF8GE_11990 [Phycisphaerales bacterium JB043]
MTTRLSSLAMISCVGVASSVHAQANSHALPTDMGITNPEDILARIDRERRLIRTGKLDWRMATNALSTDDRFAPPPRLGQGRSLRHNVNQPWGALIDGDDFVLDFEDPAYVIGDLNPTVPCGFEIFALHGLIDPVSGTSWQVGFDACYVEIVDNAAAQGGPGWDPDGADNDPSTEGVLDGDPDQHGEVGGPDPLGLHGKFLAAAAGTHAHGAPLDFGSRLEGWLSAKFFVPTPDTPVVTVVDMYFDRPDSSMWYSPLSETEGNFFVVSSYWFGYTFGTFSVLADPDNVIRRPLVLGPKPGEANTGQFYVHPSSSPWRLKTDEWFSVAIRQAVDSHSVWVRDSQTIPLCGFEQNSLYDGLTGGSDPGNTRGAFAGEIFESEWLQLIPGMDDDPGTTPIEGWGPAHNDFFQDHPQLFDSSGNLAGAQFNSIGIDAFHMRGGFDPSPTNLPNWGPNDYYIDNWVIMGEQFLPPDPPPDFAIPFTDDIELMLQWPLTVQGDGWIVNHLVSPVVTSDRNHTPGGTLSVEHKDFLNSNVLDVAFARRGIPTVTATTGTASVAQSSLYLDTILMSRGFVASDTSETNEHAAMIIFGARDIFFNVSNFIYVRLPNPAFDPTLPEIEQSGLNVEDNGSDNVREVNVRLADAGGTPLTTPVNAWFDVRVEVLRDPSGGSEHPMALFFDFGSGLVEGVADPSPVGNPRALGLGGFTSPTPSINQLGYLSGGELGGFGAGIWVDDLLVDGPRQEDAYNVEVEDPASEYIDDPAFALPYSDDLSGYERGLPIDDRGYNPFLRTVFSGSDGEVDIVPTVAIPISGVTPVYTYVITDFVLGTDISGQGVGATVCVVDNLPGFYDTTFPPVVPGVVGGSSRVNERDASRIRIAAADWLLQAGASAPWDGVTPIVGRYQFQYDARWDSPDGQNLVIDDPTSSGRGNVIELRSVFSDDAIDGDLDPGLNATLPEARARGGGYAQLEFDMYIEDDDPSDGPRGRTVWSLMGRGANPWAIAKFAFGGPNIYEDNLTFNASTGAITPGPDGQEDNFRFNEFQSDPKRIHVLVVNPITGYTFVWQDTGIDAPLNTWTRCVARVFHDGSWEVTIDDGVASHHLAGISLTEVVGIFPDVDGTDHLTIELGNDEGSDGHAVLAPIRWYSLGETAAPEGGLDPLYNPAGPGSFNDTLKNFYYQIDTVLPPASGMPTIMDINVVDGAIIGTRQMTIDDQVMFWNDQSTLGIGGSVGVPIDGSQTPRNSRWEFVDDLNPTSVLARGFWTPLGLPGPAGVADPAPLGGVVNLTPPYNNAVPYEDILQGTMVSMPQPSSFDVPAFRVLIDNVLLDAGGCVADLNGDGVVSGADLGLLLAGWGQSGASDMDGDGTTNGADLGLLLGAWGPCP